MKLELGNKILKFTTSIIEYTLILIICVYLILVIIQRINNNTSIFGFRFYTIASNSMKPIYSTNDVIIVKEVDVNKLKVGDDIAYKGIRGKMAGKLVSHRIIKIEDGTSGKIFFTQGINNEYPDQSIQESQIVGKLLGTLPVISQLNHIIKNKYGFFFLIFCPLVLVISLEIADTIINIKLEKKELIEKN